MKNKITKGFYDCCSIDELNSSSNWDHLFKLCAALLTDISDENLVNFRKYSDQMKQFLSRKCDLEKLISSPSDPPVNSSRIDEDKAEEYCITKYVIDGKLIDTEKFNASLGSDEIDPAKCDAVIVKKLGRSTSKFLALWGNLNISREIVMTSFHGAPCLKFARPTFPTKFLLPKSWQA